MRSRAKCCASSNKATVGRGELSGSHQTLMQHAKDLYQKLMNVARHPAGLSILTACLYLGADR